MTWALDWFYFGDIACLIRGGTVGADNPTPSPENNLVLKLNQMIESGDAGALERVRNAFDNKFENSDEPEFIAIVSELLVHKPKYHWTRHWPLSIKFRRGNDRTANILHPDFAQEILISKDALVIPWPLPVTASDTLTGVNETVTAWVAANVNIEELSDDDYDPATDLRGNSVLTVADRLVRALVDESPERRRCAEHVVARIHDALDDGARWRAVMGYAASKHLDEGGARFWLDFQAPVGAEGKAAAHLALVDNMVSHETWLSCDGAGALHFNVGRQHVLNLLYEPYPCGGLD